MVTIWAVTLDVDGGSIFMSSEDTSSILRYEVVGSGYQHVGSYINNHGLIGWDSMSVVQFEVADNRLFVNGLDALTVFALDVEGTLTLGCGGLTNPTTTPQSVYLDVQGELRLSNPVVPFLVASPDPIGPGVLFYGSGTTSVPLGSGTLCVTGSLARVAIGQVIQAPDILPALQGGATTVEVDLQSAPVGSGPHAIAAGSTVYFQYW